VTEPIKKLIAIQAELETLRKRSDQILGELGEVINSMAPSVGDRPKRQNKKAQRVINVESFYQKRKIK
jgi:hypothetical protein